MSLSKLESLPNEILIDIIEKYINGTDILSAFSYQLNPRFDALITGCHRLRFNFIQCRKDQFRLCMGLFPAYIGQIEELALSERDTPGQVHAFLSFFPSFRPFEKLRKLYIHYVPRAIVWRMMERAFLSLFHTSIESLSIEIEEEDEEEEEDNELPISNTLNRILIDLLHIETLRRFYLVSTLDDIDWNRLLRVPSKIEYFIAPKTYFGTRHLQSILQWAPHLKYLHIGLSDYRSYSLNDSSSNSKKKSISVSTLRTLILSCNERSSITMKILVPYLNAMPVLTRLEIDAHRELIDEYAWRMLLTTSLPLLTHFTLRIDLSQVLVNGFQKMRASFQNSFWISKKNFNVLIMSNKHGSSHDYRRSVEERRSHDDFDQPVAQCWILPLRNDDKGGNIVDQMITSTYLLQSNTLPDHYYFSNVKYLAISKIETPLIGWITTHINCSQIKKLSVEFMSRNIEELVPLWKSTPNKISLYIDFQLLLACKDVVAEENNYLRRLDISTEEHTFKEEDIIVIAGLFPRLEHLRIKTPDLHNIPLLKRYLPHLNSLTFNIKNNRFIRRYGGYERQLDIYELQRKAKFQSRCKGDWMTIWVDRAAYEDPYWTKFSLNFGQPTATSVPINISSSSTTNPTSENKSWKIKLFSFLKSFKK